jgi:hypothetical protein
MKKTLIFLGVALVIGFGIYMIKSFKDDGEIHSHGGQLHGH